MSKLLADSKRVLRLPKQFLILLSYILNPSKYLKVNSALKRYKDLYKGQNVILIANGPSFTPQLAHKVISLQPSYKVAVMNYFCSNNFSQSLVPDFYFDSDSETFKSTRTHLEDKNKQLRSYLLQHKPTLCLPYQFLTNTTFSSDIPKLPFCDLEFRYLNNIDPRFPHFYPSNTAFKSLAFLLFLGFSKVYIMGFDYDLPRHLFVNPDNSLAMRYDYSYGTMIEDLSLFYSHIGQALQTWSNDYTCLFDFPSKSRVFNVTDTSLVDAFTRMSPSSFTQNIF